MAKMKDQSIVPVLEGFMKEIGYINPKAKPPKRKGKLTSQSVPKPKTKTYTIQELAKEVGIGPNIFFGRLKAKDILQCNNLPNPSYMKDGYLTTEKVPYTFSSGYTVFLSKARVTQKGLAYFKEMFRGV